jgi:ribosomal protein L5
MHYIKNNNKIINKLELNDKYFEQNIHQTPSLEKIIISFNCQNLSSLKSILQGFAALTLISNQKPKFVQAYKSNILFKIRRGVPIGGKVTLRNEFMYNFIHKLSSEVLIKLETILKSKNTRMNKNSCSFELKDIFLWDNIVKSYKFFVGTPTLKITFVKNLKKGNSINIVKLIRYLRIPIDFK